MKIKLTLLFSLILALVTQSIAQGNIEVKGKIVDENSMKGLDYSSVSLFTEGEAKLLNGTITDGEGNFVLKVKPGTYVLKIQYISYFDQTRILEASENQESIDLGQIKLTMNTKELDEVIISGKKDEFEFSLDKRAFNVAENVSNMGKSAADILDNIPSVQVDIEGNVSLRGNDNVNILVDGKPSGLAGISNPDALRQLQGNMIERIEVITNPSARYDAEGTAGIINIILKKEARKGVNGAFNVDVGYPHNYNGAANLNYRSGKINFFVSGGLRYRRYNGTGYSEQHFTGEEINYSTIRDRTHDRGGWSTNLRTGADYYFSESSVLTGAVLIKNSFENNETVLNYYDFNQSNQLVNQELRTDNEAEDEGNYEFSLNYKKDFEGKDHNLTIYTQYRDNGEIEDSDIFHEYLTDNTDTTQHVRNDEGEKNLMFQVDYVHPFGEHSKFEIGGRANFRRIINDYLVEQLEGDEFVQLPQFSSDFEYDEDINALYAIYGNKIGNISYQMGLRMEATDITTRLINTGETNSKNYTNFFPSAHLTYTIVKGRDIQASYSRRLRRPWFRLLNPFSSFSDNRNIRTGNPDLDPEYTNAYEIGYLNNWETASVYGGVYYNATTDVIRRISRLEQTPTDTLIISQPYNLASRDSYGIEFTVSKEFGQWLKTNGSFNFFRSITEGEVQLGDENTSLSADARSWSARVNSVFTLPNKVDIQLNFNYRGPQNTTQGRRLAFYTVDLGATKDVLNGKGTVTASVQDLFNTRKWRNERSTEDFTEESEFQWRSRQFMLSFIYRLNQKKRGGRNGRGGRAPGADAGGGDL